MSPIKRLLRNQTKREKLNIISWACHESYQTSMSNINADFYIFSGGGFKAWEFTYRPLPKNHVLVPIPEQNNLGRFLPADVSYDAILVQNVVHWNQAVQLQQQFGIPILRIEHTLPPPQANDAYLAQLKGLRAQKMIFISEYSRAKWGWGESEADVIHHGIDTDLFSPLTSDDTVLGYNKVLSVVNDFVNRDWCCGYTLWTQVVKDLRHTILGKTPGLSEPAKDVNDLINHYRTHTVFLNTSTVSPIPTVVLEAASCGLPIVSTNNCMLPEIITHGENGLLSNDPAQLRKYCIELLNDPGRRYVMGQKARQTILEKFSLGKFTSNWNNVLENTISNFKGYF